MRTTKKRESMKIVPPEKKKCVWMEAGVVSFKLCDNNYDCSTCVYDQGMQLKVSRQKEAAAIASSFETPSEQLKLTETWVEKMMGLPASQRKCRYMITGEVGRKICPNAYECGSCSFDQMMQDRLQAEPLPLRDRSHVSGFELAEGIYYHEGHTWARPEYGGRVRIGLDDFAQKLLGRQGKIELPGIGCQVSQGSEGFQVRRNNERAAVLSPVDGVVAHINDELAKDPDLIHQSPYEKGWLFIVEPTKLRKNLKGLFYGEEARAFVSEESEALFKMVHGETRLAADGGVAVDEIFEEIKGEKWSRFVKTFLKT